MIACAKMFLRRLLRLLDFVFAVARERAMWGFVIRYRARFQWWAQKGYGEFLGFQKRPIRNEASSRVHRPVHHKASAQLSGVCGCSSMPGYTNLGLVDVPAVCARGTWMSFSTEELCMDCEPGSISLVEDSCQLSEDR
eukprot:4483011-Amphidinium_carterae.1